MAYLGRVGHEAVDAKPLLRWFLLASTWQRYAGSVETTLDQDLRALADPDPLATLLARLAQNTTRLDVRPEDLDDAGVQSPFFLAMYLACRANGATDWWSGANLTATGFGAAHKIELHHVFPRAQIRDLYPQKDVNELANLAFVSAAGHDPIGKKAPSQYLPTILVERLRQQFIPDDPDLWRVDQFQSFLAARRELLAAGINAVFASLA